MQARDPFIQVAPSVWIYPTYFTMEIAYAQRIGTELTKTKQEQLRQQYSHDQVEKQRLEEEFQNLALILSQGKTKVDTTSGSVELLFDTTMSIIRLSNQNLFVHSPVNLDQQTKEALDRLGSVQFIVAPNLKHHLYVSQFKKAYPNAKVFVPKGLPERKEPGFVYNALLENGYQISDEIEQFCIEGDLVNEFAFFHKPTGVLLLTDFFYGTYVSKGKDTSQWFIRLWFRHYSNGYKQYGLPSYRPERIQQTGDRKEIAKSLDYILSWDFKKLVCSHGQGHEEANPKQALKAIWSWLLKQE